MVRYTEIDIRDTLAVSEFIEYLTKMKFPFNDVYTLDSPITIPTHTHDDYEARLFVHGSGTFTIGDDVYKCSPGSYIEIEPYVKHSFDFNGNEELKVVRFFSKENKWIVNFCPD